MCRCRGARLGRERAPPRPVRYALRKRAKRYSSSRVASFFQTCASEPWSTGCAGREVEFSVQNAPCDSVTARKRGRFAPLPRVAITNPGNTCFLSSSVQLLARPLIAARSAAAAGTLAARAADVALHAVLGVQCSTASLQELLITLPCGSGWRDRRACSCERCCTAGAYRPTRAVIAARLLTASFSGTAAATHPHAPQRLSHQSRTQC